MRVQRSVLVDRPAEHLFDVIEAAEHYPRFLPWCADARILQRDEQQVSADLQVRWRGLSFSFRTRNPKRRPAFMAIHLEEGPFRHFYGEWQLTELAPDACKVVFTLDCEFDHRAWGQLAGPVFNRLTGGVVEAFVQRALAVAPAVADRSALQPGASAPEGLPEG